MGTVAKIWLKRFKRGPMDPVFAAELVPARGLRGNANQGGRRQVTIIDEASFADAGVDPSARRANVMLRGLDLRASRGRILRLGQCRLRILGETRPCERMEEAKPGLREYLRHEWRGGVFAEVLDGGLVSLGDEAAWEV